MWSSSSLTVPLPVVPSPSAPQADLDARPRQSGHGPLSLLGEGLVQFLKIDASKGAFFSAEVASRLARAIVRSRPWPEGQATTAAVLAASLLPPPTGGAGRQLPAAASPATRALDQAAADLGNYPFDTKSFASPLFLSFPTDGTRSCKVCVLC